MDSDFLEKSVLSCQKLSYFFLGGAFSNAINQVLYLLRQKLGVSTAAHQVFVAFLCTAIGKH